MAPRPDSARSPSTLATDNLGARLVALLDLPLQVAQLRAEVAELRSGQAAVREALPPQLRPPVDAAKAWGISLRTVRRMMKAGRVPIVELGGRRMIDMAAASLRAPDIAALAHAARSKAAERDEPGQAAPAKQRAPRGGGR